MDPEAFANQMKFLLIACCIIAFAIGGIVGVGIVWAWRTWM